MKTYKIKISRDFCYEYQVIADNEEEATQMAFDECEGHEEPPEYVYRLETQLSNLIGDTNGAHMCWEESNE